MFIHRYRYGPDRNHACVHERFGIYDNGHFEHGQMSMGMFVNPDIDLRLFKPLEIRFWSLNQRIGVRRASILINPVLFTKLPDIQIMS